MAKPRVVNPGPQSRERGRVGREPGPDVGVDVAVRS